MNPPSSRISHRDTEQSTLDHILIPLVSFFDTVNAVQLPRKRLLSSRR